ncbi:MAG TPA: AarF/UbiB family protein, partial [Actinomycetota bacterium]|nr:AarF/UbiB family protein [Actinomycetota bacterium]
MATDGSESAGHAVRWAADMAERFSAELILLQVVEPAPDAPPDHDHTVDALRATAEEVAGPRGRARVVVDADPARGIVQACDDLDVDVCVVGNLGMSGRTSFLLGNVPNRVSHNARCTVIIVNTAQPLTPGLPRSRAVPAMPHVAEEAGRQVEGRLLGRAARIGRVLAREGFQEVFAGTRTDEEDAVRVRARRLRAALEELGPTFAKMGQILSTRPDLLPTPFIEELSTLQDRVPPLTEQEVVKVMEEELGVPWEDVFESIEPTPMAAGTIAQVHRATLADGSRVVVKVQRPTARED